MAAPVSLTSIKFCLAFTLWLAMGLQVPMLSRVLAEQQTVVPQGSSLTPQQAMMVQFGQMMMPLLPQPGPVSPPMPERVFLQTMPQQPMAQQTMQQQTMNQQAMAQQTMPQQTMPQQTIPNETTVQQPMAQQMMPQQTMPQQTMPQEMMIQQPMSQQTMPQQTMLQQTMPQQTMIQQAQSADRSQEGAPSGLLLQSHRFDEAKSAQDVRSLVAAMSQQQREARILQFELLQEKTKEKGLEDAMGQQLRFDQSLAQQVVALKTEVGSSVSASQRNQQSEVNRQVASKVQSLEDRARSLEDQLTKAKAEFHEGHAQVKLNTSPPNLYKENELQSLKITAQSLEDQPVKARTEIQQGYAHVERNTSQLELAEMPAKAAQAHQAAEARQAVEAGQANLLEAGALEESALMQQEEVLNKMDRFQDATKRWLQPYESFHR